MKFEEKLLASFDNCISSENTSQKVARERMWTSYYLLCTSDDYISDWKAFLVKTGTDELSAIFYQYIGDYIFKQLIALKYPVTGGESCAERSETLSYEELNGLRYAAGYVPRAIRKKVTKSGHPVREDLLMCLSQLEETDDVVTDDSQDWINATYRGGFVHINNDTYELFLAMEKELRNHLKSADPPTSTKEVKDSISQAADVQYFWYLISSDWEESSAKALLEMIINEWVTLRGFSYASAWVESLKLSTRRQHKSLKVSENS